MPATDPTNAAIAALFEELADLYELDGASHHRVLAYRTGAKTVREAPRSIAGLTREGKVTSLPGIGKTLEEKITALLETGSIPAVEKLRARFPTGLVEMTRLPGLGPKKARKLFDELGLDSLGALREAAENERLRGVKGFGPKFEASVLKALDAGLGDAPAVRIVMH
ncbi:MAG: histidinol-phosphatase, partial [Solirubrobacterales bacterium]|nr:histidinol-phosphatase [Solirubrobacterales bacterium]